MNYAHARNPASMRLVHHNGRTFFHARTAVPVRGPDGRMYRGTIQTVGEIPASALRDVAGVEVGAGLGSDEMAAKVKAWLADAATKLKSLLARALRSPMAILVAGCTLFVPGWGPLLVQLFVGTRLGLWIADNGGRAAPAAGTLYTHS